MMELKDQGMQMALEQSKKAIDTRNEVTVRLNASISEAAVQKSICVVISPKVNFMVLPHNLRSVLQAHNLMSVLQAAAGVLHADGVDSIVVTPTPSTLNPTP